MSGVELFTLPTALGGGAVTLGTAATAVGTIFSAVSSISSGNAARASGDYNAAIYAQNAEVTRQRAAADEARQRRENLLRAGNLRAGYGASGVTLDGSPLDVLEMAATTGELDAQNVRYKGSLRAIGYENSAALDTAGASNALTSSYYRAGSELLSGGAKAYGSYNSFKPKAASGGGSDYWGSGPGTL